MTRYYVPWSSMFDSAPYYQATKIATIVKKYGGKNVRLARLNGWSNQPQVVCFDAPDQKHADIIGHYVGIELGFGHGAFARKKDW